MSNTGQSDLDDVVAAAMRSAGKAVGGLRRIAEGFGDVASVGVPPPTEMRRRTPPPPGAQQPSPPRRVLAQPEPPSPPRRVLAEPEPPFDVEDSYDELDDETDDEGAFESYVTANEAPSPTGEVEELPVEQPVHDSPGLVAETDPRLQPEPVAPQRGRHDPVDPIERSDWRDKMLTTDSGFRVPPPPAPIELPPPVVAIDYQVVESRTEAIAASSQAVTSD